MPERSTGEGTLTRDLDLEAAFLDAAELGIQAEGFADHARRRLQAGERAYAGRWAGVGWHQFAHELTEEAADLGAWAVLALQTIERDVPEHARADAALLLDCIARAGAEAHAAAGRLRELVGGGSRDVGVGGA